MISQWILEEISLEIPSEIAMRIASKITHGMYTLTPIEISRNYSQDSIKTSCRVSSWNYSGDFPMFFPGIKLEITLRILIRTQ